MAGRENRETMAILFVTLGTLPSTASPLPVPPSTVSTRGSQSSFERFKLAKGLQPPVGTKRGHWV